MPIHSVSAAHSTGRSVLFEPDLPLHLPAYMHPDRKVAQFVQWLLVKLGRRLFGDVNCLAIKRLAVDDSQLLDDPASGSEPLGQRT